MNTFQRICVVATNNREGEFLFIITWCAMVTLTIAVCTEGHYSFLNVLFALLAPFLGTEFLIRVARREYLDAAIAFAGGSYVSGQLAAIFGLAT